MKLSKERVRLLARTRGLGLGEALRRARVSRNAFYTLSRRASVVPRSVQALAQALGVACGDVLEEPPPALDQRAAALLREARTLHARHPRSSFDNIWHTLWLLEVGPAERLHRSLVRGHDSAPQR